MTGTSPEDGRAGPTAEGGAVAREASSAVEPGEPRADAAEEPRTGAGVAAAARQGFEPVIGLEVHVQLSTESKIFCACSTTYGAPPNTQVCPVCLGFPGSLPVLNARAVEFAVKAALALNCRVQTHSVFARKNYFYPDLPKGYQISQFDRPLAVDGWLELPAGDGAGDAAAAPSTGAGDPAPDRGGAPEAAHAASAEAPLPAATGAAGSERRIRITRLHLEEDAGKSFHGVATGGGTALDFNRCGVPLVEIVSAPDLRTPAEAHLYLARLKQLLRYVRVSDVNMEEGSLRCDANVSVRPRGSAAMGTKTEVKNLNSFRNVERALDFEIGRQVDVVAAGGTVEHETLLWDAARGHARPMRSKEMSHDYRYFPEPDLPPLVIEDAEVTSWRDELPELPDARLERVKRRYGLPPYDAGVLTATRELADWFEAAAEAYGGSPKEVSNWVMGEVLRVLNERGIEADALPLRPHALAELLALKDEGRVSGRTAKGIFERMLATGRSASEILDEENLAQISDRDELRGLAAAVLDERPQEVAAYLGGRQQLLSFFIGEVMKKTRGRANPQAAGPLLRELLESRREGAETDAASDGDSTAAQEREQAVPEGVAAALAEIPGTPESEAGATDAPADASSSGPEGEPPGASEAEGREGPPSGERGSQPGGTTPL